MKLHIIKSTDAPEIEVIQETSVYAPPQTMYLLPENITFLKWSRNLYTLEKEKNEWIRSYENVLQGLNYWRNKANEKI